MLFRLLALVAFCSCKQNENHHPETAACACPAPVTSAEAVKAPPTPEAKTPVQKEPTVATPHVTPLATCETGGKLPLEAARDFFDRSEFEKALSCAAQASALFPNDSVAHTERANALAALGRDEEAKMAYARALAVDPDSLDALMGSAHFYAVTLPSTRENDELGSLYAERGLDIANAQKDEDSAVQMGRISAMAFNDLGQPQDALERADWVLEHVKGHLDPDASYEKALALFELCRFGEAKGAFTSLLGDAERGAHAHHHLGLLLEREGKLKDAEKHFTTAREKSKDDFPEPVLLTEDEFRNEVKKAIAKLPDDMKRDIRGVPVGTEDLPGTEDLKAVEPPLSPTILGLFRGPPLDEQCTPEPGSAADTPCRSVVLYRKNLARAVKTREELIEQIRVTLLHEVGHLRGEDDFELAARGLE
ncbi:MAG: metallopeptidase family protein [Archangiaceae bacterium]|nr:metallopeptidase family protein [Archangiaceae bacterium]